jgi:hypothetical protein
MQSARQNEGVASPAAYAEAAFAAVGLWRRWDCCGAWRDSANRSAFRLHAAAKLARDPSPAVAIAPDGDGAVNRLPISPDKIVAYDAASLSAYIQSR